MLNGADQRCLVNSLQCIHDLSACQRNKLFQAHYGPHPRAVKDHVYYMKKSPQKTTSSSHYIGYKFGRLQTISKKGVEVLSQHMVVGHVLSRTLRQTPRSPKPPNSPLQTNHTAACSPLSSRALSPSKSSAQGHTTLVAGEPS